MHLSQEQTFCYSFCYFTKSAGLGSFVTRTFLLMINFITLIHLRVTVALFIHLSKLLLVEFPAVHPTMRNMMKLNDKSTEDSSLGPVVYIRIWHSQLLNFNLCQRYSCRLWTRHLAFQYELPHLKDGGYSHINHYAILRTR